MSCFKATILEVRNDQLVTMLTFKKRLKAGYFYFSLLKRFPKDLAEMLAHVNKYINAKKGIVKKQKEKRKWKQA